MNRYFGVLAIAACCVSAFAQMPPRAAAKVGDTAVFSGQQKAERTTYEEVVTITDVTPTQIKTKHVRSGRPEDLEGIYDKDWGIIVSGTNGSLFDPPSPILSFPLERGKQWDSKYEITFRAAGKGKVESKSTVAGVEKLKTPGGEYDAVRVDAKGYISFDGGRGGFHFSQSAWYAPAIDRIVRLEYKESRTMGADNVVELKEFRPAK